jgi:hypothetical protein
LVRELVALKARQAANADGDPAADGNFPQTVGRCNKSAHEAIAECAF